MSVSVTLSLAATALPLPRHCPAASTTTKSRLELMSVLTVLSGAHL